LKTTTNSPDKFTEYPELKGAKFPGASNGKRDVELAISNCFLTAKKLDYGKNKH